MIDPNFFLLYVDKPQASQEFYGRILGKAPVESSPTFAMFALDSGVMLGLWSKHTVEPEATAVGGAEVAFAVPDVMAVYPEWVALGIDIIQEPKEFDFGVNFVALDPDGHRLRVFTPNGS